MSTRACVASQVSRFFREARGGASHLSENPLEDELSKLEVLKPQLQRCETSRRYRAQIGPADSEARPQGTSRVADHFGELRSVIEQSTLLHSTRRRLHAWEQKLVIR
jgi:hypothetical protein